MKIIAVSGSLRRDSFNTRLTRVLAERAPEGVTIDCATLHGIPLYDGDVEDADGIPAAVEALRQRIQAADGLILSTPEYNGGMPGVFKNALDWLTRPPEAMGPTFGLSSSRKALLDQSSAARAPSRNSGRASISQACTRFQVARV